jgi:hypothetical protein
MRKENIKARKTALIAALQKATAVERAAARKLAVKSFKESTQKVKSESAINLKQIRATYKSAAAICKGGKFDTMSIQEIAA